MIRPRTIIIENLDAEDIARELRRRENEALDAQAIYYRPAATRWDSFGEED
jgi:hypothetical protein